jgi:3-oxoadipate enol-lactonase
MWQPQVDVFAQRFRVIRYDSRGHGRSEAPAQAYTLDRLGDDLLAVLDAVGVERAHICGLSLGGMVALWLSAYHPDRIERAVFANTGARIGTEFSWDERIAAVRSGGMPAVRDVVLARFLSERFRREHPDETQQIADIFEATPADGYIATCVALRDADLHRVLPRVKVPALIIAGDLDEATPVSLARELHSAIAGSGLTVLQGAAHLSNVEQPEVFNDHLFSFLRLM